MINGLPVGPHVHSYSKKVMLPHSANQLNWHDISVVFIVVIISSSYFL